MSQANPQETDYTRLPNRCGGPHGCGHRKDMHGKGGCTVLMGDGRPNNDEPCPCKRKYVKEA